MPPLLIALGVWCAAFAAALGGLLTRTSGDVAISGEIVVDHKPFCQSFIVRTESGFVVMEWWDGILVFGEGDRISGPLHARGLHWVEVVGRGSIAVRIEGWSADLPRAEAALGLRCQLSRDTTATADLMN
jgi:hypothetical protein